jgi:hypothetical protein
MGFTVADRLHKNFTPLTGEGGWGEGEFAAGSI